MRPRPAVLLACSLILAGVLLDGPAVRARALRHLSTLSGRTAAGLRRVSLATGLRYVDIAYPYVEETISRETASDQGNIR